VHTGVTRYVEFKSIEGSFVYKLGKIHKVPASEMEALSTGLMGMFEKRRFKKFLSWAQGLNATDPKTWSGTDPSKTTMQEIYDKFGVSSLPPVRYYWCGLMGLHTILARQQHSRLRGTRPCPLPRRRLQATALPAVRGQDSALLGLAGSLREVALPLSPLRFVLIGALFAIPH
jgi:GDP dissociation inhibitor